MVAEVLTGCRATKRALKSVPGIQAAGPMRLFGWYPVAVAAIEANDVWEMLWIPRNSIITHGLFVMAALDTNATATLDMDVGWSANGGESTDYYEFPHQVGSDGDVVATDARLTNAGYVEDTDGFGNFGVFDNDAVANVKPETSKVFRPILLPRPLYFSRDTLVKVIANATQATAAAGDMHLVLEGVKL